MQYEYKIITVSVAHFNKENFQEELSTKFNDRGKEGWDLIKMEPIMKAGLMFQVGDTTDFVIIFKKQIG